MNAKGYSKARSASAGFTVVELVVVVAMLACFVGLLSPTLARTRTNGRTVQCLNNEHRLAQAWLMYAPDNRDKLPISYHGGSAQGGNYDPALGPGWAAGWLDWTLAPDNTNSLFVINPRWASLAPYVNKRQGLFKCPSDNYLSAVQRTRGWPQRVRSYSLNVGVGQGNAEAGPWVTIYKHFIKASEFVYPGPADTWVFLEEHPDSMNDPAFFNPQPTYWIDLPATYHEGGTTFAFADGHVELHHWVGSLTRVRAITGTFPTINTPNGDPDIHWMSYHAGRGSTYSY